MTPDDYGASCREEEKDVASEPGETLTRAKTGTEKRRSSKRDDVPGRSEEGALNASREGGGEM